MEKNKRVVSKFLTNSAKGQECQVRIYGVCNRDDKTTVFAHLNGAGIGLKHHDILGAYACSSCHDEIDRRTMVMDSDYVELFFLRGIIRTLCIFINNGWLSIKGAK